MSGYKGFSKSNNAINAESEGKRTATALSRRLGVSSAAIKATLRPCEWHHTSKNYNRTEYFAWPSQAEIETMKAWEPTPEQRASAKRVAWTEWRGSGKSKTRIEHEHANVPVTIKGSWCIVHLDAGDVKKKLDGNWFEIEMESS